MTEQLSIVDKAQKRVASTPAELKGLREAAGLSIQGTAGQLRLAARQVEALELGEWDKLPGIAFIKGVLRAYGRLLSADLDPLIAQVDQQLGQSELKADRTLERKLPERSALGFGEGGKGNKWVWVGLGFVGLAAVALFFGQGLEGYIPKQWIPPSKVMDLGRDTAPASSATSSPSASNTANRDGPKSTTEVTSPSGAPALGAVPASPPPAPTSDSLKSTDQVATQQNISSANAAVQADAYYQIKFAKDSWVEIKDAGGERVLYGTQVGGTTQILKGKAPFTAVIGNATHVSIEKKEAAPGASASEQIVPMPKDLPQGIARLTLR
jgi:cytoskeleton protein RodZ